MLKTAVKSGVGRHCSGIRCSSCSARHPQVELLAELELLGVLRPQLELYRAFSQGFTLAPCLRDAPESTRPDPGVLSAGMPEPSPLGDPSCHT